MKKCFFVLSLFCGLALSLTSCGGDDDDEFDGPSQTNQSTDIIDSGKYGKFEKLTINEIPVYNCIEAMMGMFSTYHFKPDYLVWRNNNYVNEPAACIMLFMYDAPTISASGSANMILNFKKSAFGEQTFAKDVTSELLTISVDFFSKTKFIYEADKTEDFSVLAGGIKLKKIKDKKYIITFDNLKIKIKNNEVSINGSASFEEHQL